MGRRGGFAEWAKQCDNTYHAKITYGSPRCVGHRPVVQRQCTRATESCDECIARYNRSQGFPIRTESCDASEARELRVNCHVSRPINRGRWRAHDQQAKGELRARDEPRVGSEAANETR